MGTSGVFRFRKQFPDVSRRLCRSKLGTSHAPLSLTHWHQRIGEGGVVATGRKSGKPDQASQTREGDRRHHGDALSDCALNGKPAARAQQAAHRQVCSRRRLEHASEPQSLGSALDNADGPDAHATQYKRMRVAIMTLRTRAGRVQRDAQRQLKKPPAQVQTNSRDLPHRVGRILTQHRRLRVRPVPERCGLDVAV